MPAKIPVSEQTREFLVKNYSKLGYKKCAEILSLPPDRVRFLGAKLKLTRPLNKPFRKLSDEQRNFIFNNYVQLGAVKCSKILGITQGHVQKIAISKNLKTEKKYDLTETVKNLTNPISKEAAYVLGFIWADGTVSKNKVAVNIVLEDMIKIEHVFDSVGVWAKYNFKSKTHPQWKAQRFLCCNSTELAKTLINLDYKEKSQKTQTKILSVIPESLHFYFWRGYFDGDGCAIFSPKEGRSIQKSISISSSYDQDWTEIENLMDKLKITFFSTKKRIQNEKSKSSLFSISSLAELRKFIEYLYPNTIFDGIGLERKFAKLHSIFHIKGTKKSKYPNISFIASSNKWKSCIRINKKYIFIGYFSSEEDAVLARNQYIKEHNLNIPTVLI